MNTSDIFDFKSRGEANRGKVEGSSRWHSTFFPPFFNIYPMQIYENFPPGSSRPGVSSFAFVLPRQQLGRKGDNQARPRMRVRYLCWNNSSSREIYKNGDRPVTIVMNINRFDSMRGEGREKKMARQRDLSVQSFGFLIRYFRLILVFIH